MVIQIFIISRKQFMLPCAEVLRFLQLLVTFPFNLNS
jgi:hypothetical protein